MKKSNLYDEIHELKSYLLYAIKKERKTLGIRKFNEKLGTRLVRVLDGFINETKSTNINALLQIYDRLGYDIIAVKQKE